VKQLLRWSKHSLIFKKFEEFVLSIKDPTIRLCPLNAVHTHIPYLISMLILLYHGRVLSAGKALDFIREVLGFNLDRDTGYPVVLSVSQGKYWDSTPNRPMQLPSKSFPIHRIIRFCIVSMLKGSLSN
jgi:hypothetical protein